VHDVWNVPMTSSSGPPGTSRDRTAGGVIPREIKECWSVSLLRRRPLTLRGRLLTLGAAVTVALVVLAAVTTLQMTSVSAGTSSSSAAQHQTELLSRAYEAWITNDDQNNMYAAVIALREPSQARLAQVTWLQAVTAYREARADVARLDAGLRRPAERAELRTLGATLTAYDGFSLQLRQAALAGEVRRAIYIQSVANLVPSNALPAAFAALRGMLERESARSAAAVRAGAAMGTWIVIGLSILILVAVGTVLFTTTRSMVTRIGPIIGRLQSLMDHEATELRSSLERMATGDLTVHAGSSTPAIEQVGDDELGQIAHAVNGIRERMRGSVAAFDDTRGQLEGLIGEVQRTSSTVASASQEMASTSDQAGRAVGEISGAIGDVALGAERQVRMVDSARATAEGVARSISDSAAHAQAAAAAAAVARDTADEGVRAARLASEAMSAVRDASDSVTSAITELANRSVAIGTIVETITTIADQTNLLALNAAIEAARAGDQGMGFAVVADEVRQLAEQSQSAAADISALITEIQGETRRVVEVVDDSSRRTEHGAATVEQARAAFEQIGRTVGDMSASVDEIAGAARQMAQGSERVQHDIAEVASVAEQSSAASEEVSASSEQTSASAQQIAASAQQLAATAAALQQLVGHFRVSADDDLLTP
jgi:methyl-accepting chemotaxis protein